MNEIQQQELNEQLFAAVKEGKVEEVSRLVEVGADVNRANKDGRTSLHNMDLATILI